MKNITHIIYIGVLAMLTACSADNDEQATVVVSDHEINFTTNVENAVTSRATLITNDNIKDKWAHVEAYEAGKTVSYLSSNLLYDGTSWKFLKNNYIGYKYYWPASFNLDFFAYSPYVLDNTNITIGTYAYDIPTFSYAGTSPVNTTNQADNTLTEFVYAYEKGCSYKADKAQLLTFNHPFSLIDFMLDESVRCTIQSVKFTGIKNSGTWTYNSGKSDYTTWSNLSNETTVELDFSTMEKGGICYPDDINSEGHLGGPFITIPQSLADNAMIEITYTSLGSSNPVTVKSYLNKAVIKTNDNTGAAVPAWNPANKYTYYLKLNGAANEIFVAVKITDWIVEGNTEKEVM